MENQLAQKLIEAEYNGDEETFSNLMLGALSERLKVT